MADEHELVGQSVIVVWALHYHKEGAQPATYLVIALSEGLLKLQEENPDGTPGNVFWAPLTSISNINLG